MRPWLVAAAWIVWFIVTAGTGYARSGPGDRIDRRGTAISIRADLVLTASVVAGVAAALLVPAAAIPGDPWVTLALGAALAALGVALRQWAAATLGRFFTRSVMVREQHRVVTSGPYRFVRHPGYSGVLVLLLGLALMLGNWVSVLLVGIGFLVAHVPRIRAEERVLEEGLGDRYRDFERDRKRLIPGVW